jgi:hypothetical protein
LVRKRENEGERRKEWVGEAKIVFLSTQADEGDGMTCALEKHSADVIFLAVRGGCPAVSLRWKQYIHVTSIEKHKHTN